MGKEGKIRTKASTEAMRWADDDEGDGPLFREPSSMGNEFDVRMKNEPDGVLAAKKIVDHIGKRGVCVCEANAPEQLIEAAYFEASELWEDGAFAPPLRVHDDRSMLEAQLWGQALKDEEKVVWIRDATTATGATAQDSGSSKGMNALKLLAKNMSDFAAGLGELLQKEQGIEFDRIGHAMLSCYTGDRQYCLHLDNAHGEEDSPGNLPDNGMRLTCTYYFNPHWDPDDGNQGGLDLFLTDPKESPASASSAKKSPKLRVAPHADTLVMFLSDRMAHRVIPTRGKDSKWFALTVWALSGTAMNQMTRKMMAMRQQASKADSDSDD